MEVDVAGALLPDWNDELSEQVLQSGQKFASFEAPRAEQDTGIARLYLPLFKDDRVHMILGAESRRQSPFSQKQEKFLTIAGTQLLVALDNIRLTEQTAQLAAAAERGRIAREIHDGVAQLVYMLSLNAETCATQAHRIAEASEEDAELLTPLAECLDKQVTISKQALWETRNYMFNLRPLLSGTLDLTEMLRNQAREFTAISGLPVHLEVTGEEISSSDRSRQDARHNDQIGSAIFRIVQEALTNAYKHAEATRIEVALHYHADDIEVEISDDGHGLQPAHSYELPAIEEQPRIYSGRGLRGMHDRADELGGTLTLLPGRTGGVIVQVRLPLPRT
jgi:signal transduction histidine kinase